MDANSFLQGLMQFVDSYKWVLLFYLLIILIIYINRSKFEIQAKIIALYRTKFGLKFIDRVGEKYRKIIKILGYIGIPLGFIGMGFILYVIGDGILKTFTKPTAPPVISPVLPGLPVVGTDIVVPFFHGIIALFIVVIIHEWSHGIVARAHKIPIKSTGFVLFGPLPGAFVDPDEKKVKKSSKAVQLSIFAAGPFSNMLTALLIIVLTLFVLGPLLGNMLSPVGFYVTKVSPDSPAAMGNVPTNVVFTKVNDTQMNGTLSFIEFMNQVSPGGEVILTNEKSSYTVKTAEHPQNKSKPYIGIELATKYEGDDKIFFKVVMWLYGLINWLFIFSLGLGLANLLPLGPVDGGRMFHVAMMRFFGEEKGNKIWVQVSIVILFILIFLLFHPFLKMIFP